MAVVIVQWTDLITSKTRRISILKQGFDNWTLNFGLLFEAALAILLSYTPGMDKYLHMYPLRGSWWLLACPFAALILVYDEARKYIIRSLPRKSWWEQELYY